MSTQNMWFVSREIQMPLKTYSESHLNYIKVHISENLGATINIRYLHKIWQNSFNNKVYIRNMCQAYG